MLIIVVVTLITFVIKADSNHTYDRNFYQFGKKGAKWVTAVYARIIDSAKFYLCCAIET